MKILSVDAETNGLHGQPFAIGAICTDDTGTANTYLARCPIDGPTDPWVAANVLPALNGITNRFAADDNPYASMLADFAAWYDHQQDGDPVVIAHVGVPVEARLFADMVRVLGRDPFSGPFPLHDLATLLYAGGWDPLSADNYITRNGLAVPVAAGMSPHNPLYDAAVAEVAWRHLASTGAANRKAEHAHPF
jgi:hypothetical protein